MHNPVHQHDIGNLVIYIVFASNWVTMEVVACGHVVSVWSENEVDVLQLEDKRLGKEVPHGRFDVKFADDSCLESVGHVVLVEHLVDPVGVHDGVLELQLVRTKQFELEIFVAES